jgi:hypothetical protein
MAGSVPQWVGALYRTRSALLKRLRPEQRSPAVGHGGRRLDRRVGNHTFALLPQAFDLSALRSTAMEKAWRKRVADVLFTMGNLVAQSAQPCPFRAAVRLFDGGAGAADADGAVRDYLLSDFQVTAAGVNPWLFVPFWCCPTASWSCRRYKCYRSAMAWGYYSAPPEEGGGVTAWCVRSVTS